MTLWTIDIRIYNDCDIYHAFHNIFKNIAFLMYSRVARGRGFSKKPRPRITEAGKAEIEVEGQIWTRDRGPRITEVFRNLYNFSKST